MDFHDPYLARQLIAYIGNKRRLLPLIHQAVEEITGPDGSGLTFLDLFAGSGAVSRLARRMGFRVVSNDWEVFCRPINTAHITVDPGEARTLFAAEGGLEAVLAELQAPGEPAAPWVSRYYAPRSEDPDRADYRTERLFYTRANALAIDLARERIEARYPADGTAVRDRQRSLLIAPLLYQAATHTNTSGVFKAYHKGFGGHGRDALPRILGPVRLERPVLIPGAPGSQVRCEDANALARVVTGDVAYLDPPYATHQYGSNYHLLTSIALWDRPTAPLELDKTGRLRDKAGIRGDWTRTRSAYCSRATAEGALQDLLSTVDARWILLSYSSEGLVPFDRILDLCDTRGQVRVRTNEYTVYPGGRQSSTRRRRNVEAVLVVDTTRRSTSASRASAARELARRRAELLLTRRYRWSRLVDLLGAPTEAGVFAVPLGCGTEELRWLPDATLAAFPALSGLALPDLLRLTTHLDGCVCRDAEEELGELVRIARQDPSGTRALGKHLVRGLRKLAHRSNYEVFAVWLRELRALAGGTLDASLDEVETLASRRRGG